MSQWKYQWISLGNIPESALTYGVSRAGNFWIGLHGTPTHKKEITPMQRLLTVQEVSEILSVSPSTVTRLIRGNALSRTWIGRSIRVKPEELERFIESRTLNSAEASRPF